MEFPTKSEIQKNNTNTDFLTFANPVSWSFVNYFVVHFQLTTMTPQFETATGWPFSVPIRCGLQESTVSVHQMQFQLLLHLRKRTASYLQCKCCLQCELWHFFSTRHIFSPLQLQLKIYREYENFSGRWYVDIVGKLNRGSNNARWRTVATLPNNIICEWTQLFSNRKSLKHRIRFSRSNCSVQSDLLCLGNRSFQKQLKCNWTHGYKWTTALLISITLGGFGADRWEKHLSKWLNFEFGEAVIAECFADFIWATGKKASGNCSVSADLGCGHWSTWFSYRCITWDQPMDLSTFKFFDWWQRLQAALRQIAAVDIVCTIFCSWTMARNEMKIS